MLIYKINKMKIIKYINKNKCKILGFYISKNIIGYIWKIEDSICQRFLSDIHTYIGGTIVTLSPRKPFRYR